MWALPYFIIFYLPEIIFHIYFSQIHKIDAKNTMACICLCMTWQYFLVTHIIQKDVLSFSECKKKCRNHEYIVLWSKIQKAFIFNNLEYKILLGNQGFIPFSYLCFKTKKFQKPQFFQSQKNGKIQDVQYNTFKNEFLILSIVLKTMPSYRKGSFEHFK